MRQNNSTLTLDIIEWDFLKQSAQISRSTESSTSRGVKRTFSTVQTIQANVQNHRGNTDERATGIGEHATHIMFCNRTIAKGSSVATDLKVHDQIICEGIHYRVLYVEEAAGWKHHYEAYMLTIDPTTSDI